MKIKKLQKKRIAILGFGKEGKSSLAFLLRIGVKNIGVFDDNEKSVYDLSTFFVDTKKSFDFEVKREDERYFGKVLYRNKKKVVRVNFYFGKYSSEELSQYDAIIKAPGISPYQDKFSNILEKFTSQTQIFYNNYGGKIIGITGTKGKSTISSFTYKALKNAHFKVKLVGNIGTPVLDEIDIDEAKKYDFVVYETSSYMLDQFQPRNYISVLNNVYTCHLDWHKTFENYQQSKLNILKNSKYRLLNNVFSHLAGKEKFDTFGKNGDYFYKDHHFYIGKTRVASDKNSKLLGVHNMENVSAVVGILHKVIKKKHQVGKIVEKTLKTFTPLEHRLEKVGKFKGITFVNDAIAVTPEATIAAIKTFTPELETLFLGGKEAGYDFHSLEEYISGEKNIRNIVLFPDANIFPTLFSGILEEKEQKVQFEGREICIIKTRSMKKGVEFAFKHTSKGKVALLSCAAQSFSLWKNFEVKGTEFKKYVHELGV